jgi:hypothetical protein
MNKKRYKMDTNNVIEFKIFFFAIISVISSTLTYLGIPKEPFLLFGVILLGDFITGIYKAKVLGESITSNKAKYGIISKFSLMIIPLTLAIGVKAIGMDGKPLFVYGLNLLILSEVYSVIGNIYTIRTKQELPEWDVISLLGKKIRTFLEGSR